KQLADLTGVDERRLRESLQARPRHVRRETEEEGGELAPGAVIEPSRANKAQQTLIQLAFIENETVLNLLADQATAALFSHPALKDIWQALLPGLRAGTIPEAKQVLDQLEDEAQRQVLSRLVMSSDSDKEELELAIDCLSVLLKETLQAEITERRRTLRQAEKEAGQPPTKLVKEVIDLQQELAHVERRFEKYRQA
ncbi:MAG: hypothetical protein V3W14_02330, partial [Candidatus Neomarinimicrobiota bacterium]